MNNRGSEWTQWDLHIHTPLTHLANNYNCTIDEFNAAVISSKATVVGITNYFTITPDEIEKIAKPIAQHKSVLLNFEFRISQPNKQGEFINLHVVFADINKYQDILDCLSRVELVRPSSEPQSYCKFKDLDKIGYDRAVIEFGTLVRQLQKDFVELEDYVLISPSNGYGGFRPKAGEGRGTELAITYDKESHVIFGSGAQDEAYFQSTSRYPDAIAKPVFKGSDAHQLGDICKSMTWVKARPNFRGLVEAIHEPVDRVCIGEKPPQLFRMESKPECYIKSISFSSVDPRNEWFDRTAPLDLNPGLVSIIGNKGSGKSALADIIALSGNSHIESFSFLDRKRFLSLPVHKKFSSTITYMNGISATVNFGSKPDLSKKENILYLTQTFIEDLCTEISSSEKSKLRDEINKVVFNHIPTEERLGKANLHSLIEHHKKLIGTSIDAVISEIKNINTEIVDLESKTSLAYRKKIEANLVELQQKLQKHDEEKPTSIEETAEPKEAIKIKRLNHWKQVVARLKEGFQEQLNELRKFKDQYQLAETKVRSLFDNYTKIVAEIRNIENLSSKRINISKLVSISIDMTALTAEIIECDNQAKQYRALLEKASRIELRLDGMISSLSQVLSDQDHELEERRKKVRTWDDTRTALVGTIATPESIEYYQNELLRSTNELVTEHSNLVSRRNASVASLIGLIAERESKLRFLYQYSNEKIERIAQEYKIDQSDFISFSSEQLLSLDFKSEFLQHINLSKQGAYFHYKESEDDLLERIIRSTDVGDNSSLAEFPIKLLKSLQIQNYDPSSSPTQDAELQDIDSQLKKTKKELYDFLFTFKFLKNQFTINYSGKPIEFLSPGEKGILLLSFFLLFDASNKPIIIDQPEENLDNETIFKKLAQFIKTAKKSRQIILVTHNPNLGIVCDSEQIIVAKMRRDKDNRIRYESGAIEDAEIKAYALQILEGTQPAFKSRIQKYSLS